MNTAYDINNIQQNIPLVVNFVSTGSALALGCSNSPNQCKMWHDLNRLYNAVIAARNNKKETLNDFLGGYNVSLSVYNSCLALLSGINLADHSKVPGCWDVYKRVLDIITVHSGINVENTVDLFGRPYVIMPLEGVSDSATECPNSLKVNDMIFIYNANYAYYQNGIDYWMNLEYGNTEDFKYSLSFSSSLMGQRL